MTPHEEIQQQIPAYAASRLDPAEARLVEEHLAGCEACREMIATTKGIAGAIREGGESMFEPHPAELALRDFAAGAAAPADRARIGKHIEACATCRLEIEAWNTVLASPGRFGAGSGAPDETGSRGRFGRSPDARGEASPRAGFSRWLTPSLTAAAGLILGALLVTLTQKVPEPPVSPEPAPAPAAAMPEKWTVPSPLFVLPGMLRGNEGMPASKWVIGKGDSHLSIAVQPVVPPEMPDDASCRFELVRDDGTAAWTMEMTAGKMREHLATPTEVVHLTLPTAGLVPGIYGFRILPVNGPPAPPIYSASVQIAHPR